MTATPLRLRGLTKGYGEANVLEDLNLEVPAGKLLTLLGPSGCGKTTTLNLIAGLLEPNKGKVYFGERDVTALAPERREVGVVFQRYALFPHMNVFDNVAFGLSVRGVNKRDIKRSVAEVLARVRLEGFEKRYPRQLSGGQQQRVAIARTLVTKPKLLLMDEPLSNLDASLREELRRFIRDLQQDLGITTLFVTHDQEEALELSDTVGVMFGGRLEQVASPQDLFNKPSSEPVARFMGARNFVPVEALQGACALTPLGTFMLGSLAGNTSHRDLLLTVRPERLELRPTARSAEANTVRVRVVQRRYLGAALRYELRANGLGLSVDAPPDVHFDIAAEAALYFPPQHLHLLPRSSERVLP